MAGRARSLSVIVTTMNEVDNLAAVAVSVIRLFWDIQVRGNRVATD